MRKDRFFKVISGLLALILLFNCFIVQAEPPKAQFSDVKETAWYYNAVNYAVEKGLMNGVGNGNFSPDGSATRAMLVTLLHRMEGKPKVSAKTPFTDLNADWYKASIAWAYANKIVNGTSAITYSPDAPLTREQFATILYRYCKKYPASDVRAEAQLSGYPDHKDISGYAKDAMLWANAEGLITGSDEGGTVYLRPKQTTTRAQMATIFQRFDAFMKQETKQPEPEQPTPHTCDFSGTPVHSGKIGSNSTHLFICQNSDCNKTKEVACTVVSKIHPKTCTDDETIEYNCAVCGYHQVVVTSLATGHTWKEASHLQGTQASASKHIIACNAEGCTESYTEDCTIVSKIHPKTCTDDETIEYNCAVCGYHQVVVTSLATGHTWKEASHLQGTDTTESKHIIACSAEGCTESYTEDCTIVSKIHPKTCTDDETIEYNCAVCGYHQVVVTSLATGHTWKEASHLQGTDTTESKHIIACSAEGCTESYTEDCTIVSKIHPKTCTDDETTEYNCALCGYHQVVVTSLATGHTWKNAVHLQGTHANASKHIVTCRAAGCTESYTEACALTKTSVGPGIIRYHCSACGYQETMPDQSGTPVRIMTQNLRFNSAANQGTDNDAQLRQYRFQALVENYDPDIIAAQEFDAFWENALPSLLGDEYSIYYKYRESPKGSNEASAILWKTAKYDLLDQGYFWLSENPNSASPAGFGQYHPRITNWVKLRDKTTGDKIVIYSTHLGSGYTLENIQYIRGLFTERIQDHPDATCFVMGDFNFSYDEDLYPAMADGSNLVDLRLIAAQMNQNDHCTLGELRTGTYNGFKKPDGSTWIDFIFAPPNDNVAIDFYGVCYDQIAVPSQNIAEGYVSDHFAVLTDVRINTDISYGQYWSPES